MADHDTLSPLQLRPETLALLASVTEAALLLDSEGLILAANGPAADLFGLPAGHDLHAVSLAALLPEDMAGQYGDILERIRKRGKAHREEWEIGDRSLIHTFTPIRDASPGDPAVALYVQDVTEIRRRDEDLRREQQRQIFYMESLPGLVFLLGQDYTIRYTNRYFRKYLGRVNKQSCHQVFKREDEACSCCPALESLRTGHPQEWEWTSEKGHVFQMYSHPMTDVDGENVAMVLGIDITRRVRIEETLKEIQQYQRAILDNIPDMAWLKDRDGLYVAVNEAFAANAGATMDDIVGSDDLTVWDKDMAAIFRKRDQAVMQTGQRSVSEEIIVTGEGEYRWLETVRSPIFDDSGQPLGLAGIAHDITERKRATDRLMYTRNELERRVRERTSELEQVNLALTHEVEERKRTAEELLKAKRRAEVATQAKSTFLANMSHEIRTPLNVILGSTDLALSQARERESLKHMSMIQQAGATLLTVINDILDFSKVEAGKLLLDAIPFDLHHLLEQTARVHRSSAEAKHLALDLSLHPDTPQHLTGDPSRLRQVLNNLLGNAVKFTSTGSVHLSAKPIRNARTPGVRFTVTDSGVGIPRDSLPFVFDSFTQADSSITREFGGTGLGLSICKRLVELMGGNITVSSALGQGSSFTFTAFFEPGREPSAERVPVQPETLHLAGLAVLVVEDNDLNSELMMAFLDQAGITATRAVNGREALDILADNSFDIILMDIQMPEMDGVEATRRIRNSTSLAVPRDIPIIAMTAHALKGDRERLMDEGMDGYISKPINLEALLHELKNCLGSSHRSAAGPEQAQEPLGDGKSEDTPGLINRREALSRLMHNESLLAHLESIFIRDTPNDLETLRDALDSGNMQEATIISHTIKGTAATVGAKRASALARRMEQAASEGRTDQVRTYLPVLEEEIRLILDELARRTLQ